MTQYVPIRTSLAALEVVTGAQRDRLETLIESFHAQSASLFTDRYPGTNLLFALYDAQNNVILAGLIEPDGRSHT